MLTVPATLTRSPGISKSPSAPISQESKWQQAYNLWLNSRASPNTRRAYAYAWTSLQSFLGKAPLEITRADIAQYLDALRAAGLSSSTLNQRLAAISSFYSYASDICMAIGQNGSGRSLFSTNPAQSIPRHKSTPFNKSRYLTPTEARALLRAIPRQSLQGLRDYALFLTYLFTGRRNSEIRCLRYGDFEFESFSSNTKSPKIYYRWSGKGSTRRDQIPLPAWDSIDHYLHSSGKLPGIQPKDYIFTPLSDCASRLPNVDPDSWTRRRPLSSRQVGALLKKYARRAGLDPQKVHVHMLRHTAAMLRKHAGDDLDQISSFLGHSNLSTTQIYLHHLEGQSDSSWARVVALLGV